MHQSSNRYSSLCLRAARLTLGCLVATIFFSAAWAGAADAPIVIRGSKNLQPVVVQWADSFAQTAKAPPLDIVATGTSQGIEDLLAGHADIAMASRPISQDEVAAAADKGLSVRETIVARMGIAVIVNHDNPVSSVSVGRLAEIFSGDVQNWQTVGGPDEPITVVRKTSGWSPDFFHHTIMGDKEFTADSVIVDSKQEVVIEIAGRTWSIGFTGMTEALPALDRIKLLRLTSETSDEDSTYALSRPLFFYTIESSATVQPFLKYATGPAAQEMIVETGFYPAQQADTVSSD